MAGGSLVETEVKLRIASAAAAREALAKLGAVLRRARSFEDNVLYDDAAGSLRASGRVLRLRQSGDECVLTLKGAKRIVEGAKSRDEHETRVGAPGAMKQILLGAGYAPVFRYQKYRESWSFAGLEIVVDETPIGVFLELEGELREIHAAAAALGYSARDYLADSYVSLFFASGGRGDMVFA